MNTTKSIVCYDTLEEMEERKKIVKPIIEALYNKHGFVVEEVVREFRIRNNIISRRRKW